MTNNNAFHTNTPEQAKDHMVTGEVFSLVWQAEFKAYKTEPIPTDLAPYYDHPDYISHNEEATGILPFVYRLVRNYNIGLKLNWLKSAHPRGKSLLDYGSGTGDFLKRANKDNWRVSGLEVNELARTVAQKKGVKVYKNQADVSDQVFDVITLWHVLEHLNDPLAMMQWFSNHLTAEGVLIIAVPNHRSYDAKYYREYWAAYDVPRHLWHFSKESIRTIFKDHFELVKTHPMWFDSIYVSLLSERYKKNKGNLFRGIVIGFLSNLKAMFTNEPSSRVYVLKKRN